ncbi:MAG: hypothetical protein ACP5G4_07450 [bacterium]
MRRVALLLILFVFSVLAESWFCHSDLGNDAWSGAEMDSAKASFGGAIAEASSGDTIFACGRSFDEQVNTSTPLTICAWPDSARWSLTYDSTGYAIEGPFRLHDGCIQGLNAARLTGDYHYIDCCSLIASQYYILYLSGGSSCSLSYVYTEGTAGDILFIYRTPFIFIGEGCNLTKSSTSSTYGLRWSSQNVPLTLQSQPEASSARLRYWKSSSQNSIWFTP